MILLISFFEKANSNDIHKETFACAINCMDGRVQQPVADYLKKHCCVDYADAITEPGPCKILAENLDSAVVADIQKRIDISVNKHNSKVIAIVAHPECAGNPVDKNHQVEHLYLAYKKVKSFGFKADILLLWVENDWKTVTEIEKPKD